MQPARSVQQRARQAPGSSGTVATTLERIGRFPRTVILDLGANVECDAENLVQFAEQARVSRKLVELRCDVPLETPLDDLDGAVAAEWMAAFVTLIENPVGALL